MILGDAMYFGYVVKCLRFCQFKFFCICVAFNDLVHDVEIVFQLF